MLKWWCLHFLTTFSALMSRLNEVEKNRGSPPPLIPNLIVWLQILNSCYATSQLFNPAKYQREMLVMEIRFILVHISDVMASWFHFLFGSSWGRMLGLEDFVKPKYLHSGRNERNRLSPKQITSFIAFPMLQWNPTSYFLPPPSKHKEFITGLNHWWSQSPHGIIT